MSAIDIFARQAEARARNTGGMFGTIADRVRRYRSYRQTASELSNLSERELNDLGITRGDIGGIAYRAAYGS